MRALLLAAGLGTRLRPLTDHLPKPAVPVLHRPLGARSLERLLALGVRSIAINTHHLGDAAERALRPLVPSELPFVRSHEDELLGTAGGVKRALALAAELDGGGDDDAVVMNGDVIFAPDLERAIALHRSRGELATMGLRADPEAARYGAIELDGGARVRRILGRPASVEGALRALMFTGVHVLSARALRELPERGCVIRQGYIPWLERGELVVGIEEAAPWRDLGTIAEYHAANIERAHEPGAVDASAEIEGAHIERCVIGAQARVAAGVHVRRCVVWPGTAVLTDASDAVIGPFGVVPAG